MQTSSVKINCCFPRCPTLVLVKLLLPNVGYLKSLLILLKLSPAKIIQFKYPVLERQSGITHLHGYRVPIAINNNIFIEKIISWTATFSKSSSTIKNDYFSCSSLKTIIIWNNNTLRNLYHLCYFVTDFPCNCITFSYRFFFFMEFVKLNIKLLIKLDPV